MNNFIQILTLVLQALTARSTAFAVTIGAQHYAVTIVQNASPGHMAWLAAFQIVATVLAGAPGSFTIGVFTVTIQVLQPASIAPPVPASVPAAPRQ